MVWPQENKLQQLEKISKRLKLLLEKKQEQQALRLGEQALKQEEKFHAKEKTKTSNNPTRPKKKSNSSKRSSKGMVFGKKIPILSNPTVRKIFIASGAASIIGTVVAVLAPQFSAQVQSPIAKGIIGFLTGDLIGGAANFLLPTLAGGAANGQSSNGGNGGNFA